MAFKLERNRIDKVSKKAIIDELKRVAEHYGYREFTGREFDKVATKCKKTTVLNNFDSWTLALKVTGLELKSHKKPRKDQIPEQQLFIELERIWKLLGHRPSRNEWEASSPKYSYTTYKSRFDGWVNACARFIDYKSGGTLLSEDESQSKKDETSEQESIDLPQNKKRHIPLGLRLEVLKRDNYRCAYCGRSPATEVGVVLHIDHVAPFSKKGETVLNNLQCLCDDCNLGKSNKM